MADSKPSLLVTIKKFCKKSHIGNISSSKISAGFHNLAILDHNGCLFIRNVQNEEEKSLQNVAGFEWGTPATSSQPDEDCLQISSVDYLFVVKHNFALELYHVEGQDKKDDKEDVFTVSCEVEVKEELLKALLRDRGKGDFSIVDLSVIAMETKKNPINHIATLLVNHKYIVVLSLSVSGPEIMYCFAMDSSTTCLPVVVPVSSLIQVKRCQSLIFCLFSSGTAIIYLINGEFIGCIDIQSYHFKSEGTDSDNDDDYDDTSFPKEFIHLEITDDLSVLVSSDESNNIYTINLDDYFNDNPNHLCFKNKMIKKVSALLPGGLQYSSEDEDLLIRNTKMADIGYGDRFWKNELVDMRLQASHENCVTGLPSGRWFSHIKEIKFSIPTQRSCHNNNPSANPKLTGFLLKRKRSEARSATPSSESSLSISKDPVMSKCLSTEVKSLIYRAGVFINNHKLVQMSAASDSLVVWFKPEESDQGLDVGVNCPYGLLYLYGYGSAEVAYHQIFSEPTVMVQSSDSLQPVCVLSKKQLSIPSFGANQNQFVHKVIMYENAALAEAVCHINQWDHCIIPLEALQVALKHRQLDTIAFFLKTQENVFTKSAVSVTSPTSTLSPQQSFTTSPAIYNIPVAMDTRQTEDVIIALVSSVKKNAKQHHNRQFTNQLLQMTLKYLHCLLQDGTQFIEMKRTETDTATQHDLALVTQVEICLMFVTKSVDELRHYLGNLSGDDGVDDVDSAVKEVVFSSAAEASWDAIGKWISMGTKDIIRDAVINGAVGAAQAFFMSESAKKVSCDGSLSSMTTTGLEIMLTALVNQDVDTAIKIITNLGRDVINQLHVLCFNTLHRPLREFLVCELRSRGQLTPDEEGMITFLHALENLYDTESYDLAKESMKPPPESWTDLGLLHNSFSLNSTHILELNIETGSLLPGQPYNQSQHGGYVEVLLDWVKDWSPEERQRILFERILWNRDSSKNTFPISAKAIWHYFTVRADWEMLKSWIRAMAGQEVSHDNFSISVGDELFVCHDKMVLPCLTCDVYSEFQGCPVAVKEIIVDELTRYGLFTFEQLSNLPVLLYHLGRTQTLFSQPHPLANLDQSSDHHGDVNQSQIMSLGDFHSRFIDHCIKMQFVNVLYYYLDYYRLAESLEDVCELNLHKDQPAWVEMMIAFRLAGIKPEDKDATYHASFSNARFILDSESSVSISDMFREGRPIMALATLMYGPRPISQAIVPAGETPEHVSWQVDEDLLRRSLSSYPKLLNALFPVATSIYGTEPQDITVYQLLQGNCQFEISRLFGWQRTNVLAIKSGNVCEMPHFSHAPSISKHAHKEQLTFCYYLRHGRPSFAFSAFITTQLKEPSITKTSLNIATKKAYRVAIQNFTNTQITSACVAFYEMLGVDSKRLRVDLMACNRILSHGGRDCMQTVNSREGNTLKDKIVSELMSRRSNLQTFLPALEEATSNLISSMCPEKTSFEASQHWALVIDFCYGHKVDLSTRYLVDCAIADQWLPFVCFAQKWQFPKHQVLDVVDNYFSNRHFKEHLTLAFENVQIIRVEETEEETTKKRRRRKTTKKDKPQVVTPTKDIRAQFYARMGLNKRGQDPPAGHHSSSAEEEDDKSKVKRSKTSDKDSGSATDGTVTAVDETSGTKSLTDSHERPLDPDKLPDDFFDVLFSCNSANIPWRSLLAHAIALHRPLFAVLAACFEESKSLDCICAWLFSTYNSEILNAVTQDIAETHWRRWTTRDLMLIITSVVKYKATYAVTLAKAFYIFEPTNPMFHFLRFHESFVVYIDFDNCQKELDLFKKEFSKLSIRESSLSHTSHTVTREIRWIEEVTSLVTQQMVRQCDNSYEQGHLLSLLAKAMLGRNYAYKTPNYYQLHKINEIVQDTKVVVDFSLLLDGDSKHAAKEKDRILYSLLHHKEFVKARDYARLLQLPEDPITLKEVQHERESIENSVLWEIKQGRLAFWHKADKCFKENRCDPEIGASFFEAQADDPELSFTEKSRLLSMTMKWFSKSTKPQALVDKMIDLERRIWLFCIRAEMEANKEVKLARSVSHLEFLPSSSDWATGFPVPFSDAPTGDIAEPTELIQAETLDDIAVTCADLLTTDEEFSALERVIGQLLENCHVIQARRLAVHFGYTSQDLDIVLSCIYLSQGTRFADTLDSSIRKLLHQTPHRRMSMSGTVSSTDGIKRSSSFVLSTSLTESVGGTGRADDSISVDWIQVEDTITAMETLMYYCEKGKRCCSRIINCYKISQTLGLEYEAVVNDKPFNVLHSLLVSGFDSRFKLAEAYIKAFELNANEVVGFLKDIILLSLRVYCGEELSSTGEDHELIFNAAPSCDDIIEVIKLCSDQALLGNRLLETAGRIANDRIAETASDKALNIEVELLVRAHECHTMACNMEGITSVLKCGKHLTDAIAAVEKFPLMVRLLTGIGRFREMSYIFDTLLRHHYFELLFQRGLIDKENKLKVALLEYLKRSHPDDTEKYKMVAMRFSMHRELADRWKNSAMEQLHELKDQTMSARPELQSKLTSIMNSFKYAADYYTKDNCFKLSQTCLKYARLIQLQIHLLAMGVCVINLDERGLKKFLAQHNHFFESLLVVDAYSKKGSGLWISAVYNHVIINGDFKYWQELRSVMIPSSTLFVDVATKYKNSESHSNQEIQNMKKLLHDLAELRVRYRIASDLGFRDISSAMLEGEGGAYLKDILGL